MITIDLPSSPSSNALPPAISKLGLTRFLNSARVLCGLNGEVDVLLTGDAELKRLNRTFRGKNKPTDVLSFPAAPEIALQHAGDLAISLETAARQAEHYGHSLRDEVRILLLHGLLHLAGFDHEADGGEMAVREAELRARFQLPVGLIRRAAASLGDRKAPRKVRVETRKIGRKALAAKPRKATP